MLKLVLVGIWVALVTAASAYFSAGLMTPSPTLAADDRPKAGLEEMVSDMTSVPVVRGDGIAGYIIIQLTFEVDKAKLAELKFDPKPYLADAAFRGVYDASETDFARLRASDIDKLLARIKDSANARIGAEVIRAALVKELNYVRKEDIRTHWIKQN
jgi:hypothetical protein